MPKEIDAIVGQMKISPQNIRHEDAKKVCEYYFGPPR
jgi:hypothetical protein